MNFIFLHFNITKYNSLLSASITCNHYTIMTAKFYFRYFLFVFVIVLFSKLKIMGQASTANYTFTATANGTLTDMVSGTTTLINPDVDGLNTGTFSVAHEIGFTFYYMGKAYTEFVATEDGVMRFGNSLTSINRVPSLDVDEPRLVPFACDMRTGSNGKVHYKVTGSSPNRIFTIEWKNMIAAYSLTSQTGNTTFQVRLYESDNVIEFVYGYMYAAVHRTGQEDYGNIGISDANAANGILYKTDAFNNSNSSTASPSIAILPSLVDAVGEISGLSSTSDGYRMVYKFTPISLPDAPSGISFSGISYTDITVNWTDNSDNEAFFYVSRSEDGGNTYEIVAIENADVTSTTVTGLPSKSYWFKVEAVNEGGISAAVSGETQTLAAGEIYSQNDGNWSSTSTWNTGSVPTNTDNVTISDGHTVTIDNTSAVCNDLTVGQGASGHLQFAGAATSATLTCDGDVTITANGTFDIVSGASGGTRQLIIGNRSRANSNLTVNGTFDMYVDANSYANVYFNGNADGELSGDDATTCDFYSITVDKGSDANSIINVTREITMSAPSSSNNLLTITNGTFKLSSASTITPYFGTQTIVSATGRLWLNNSSAIIRCVNTGSTTGAGDISVTDGGILQITAGTFGYGGGDNTFSLNGTLKLESASATLNMYGKLDVPNSGYLIMSDGAINLDTRTSVSLDDHTLEFGATAFALVSGGTITIVDPPASTSWDVFRIPDTGESNKNFSGLTLQLGDGISTTAGSSYGFVINTPTQYRLSLGNITVNSDPTATNRHVSFHKIDGDANDQMMQDLTITSGIFQLDDYGGTAQSFEVYGDVTIATNGTLDASVSGGSLIMSGAAAQTISGSGSISATNNFELEINNPSGVTLGDPLEVYTLVLTDGLLTTTSTNLLTILANTTTGSGNTSSWVNGPLKRILPSGTNDITFPVGKGSYNLIEMINAITTAADVSIIAEVFDEDCQGTYSNGDTILNDNRYWSLDIVNNASNFTSSQVRVTEVGKTTGQVLTHSSNVGSGSTYTTFSRASGAVDNTILSYLTIGSSDVVNYFAVASSYFSGDYNVGTGETYTSFTGATDGFFAAINASGLRGDITAYVTSDLTETCEIALDEWNEANGSGYNLTILSSASATRTISGSEQTVAAGGEGAMIKINGADNVTFDGTVNRYLVFQNNTTNAANTSATFEIYGGATHILIDSCIVENQNNSITTQGVISLGSGTNTDITITGCYIRDASSGYSGYPYCSIYSNNTENSTLTISNNAIYNFGNYGLNLNAVGDNITISGNSFYKTLTDNLSTIDQVGIYINSGNNHSITENYIGGQAALCAGAAWTNNDSSANIKGIVLHVGTTSATSVQGNSIRNFDVQGTSGTSFTGIEISAGLVNVGTVTGDTITDIISGADDICGIKSTTTSSILLANNEISNITASGTGASSSLKGITHEAASFANVTNNSVYNLSSASNLTDITEPTVVAIYLNTASNPLVSKNTIYNISATETGVVQTNAAAIALNTCISANVEQNKIYGIKNASTKTTATAPPTANGLVVSSPVTGVLIKNNLISLGNAENSNTEFNGIWLNENPGSSANTEIYYNSVVISGNASSGALSSFALLRGDNSSTALTNYTMTINNNVFVNARTGGTGYHYAIANQGNVAATGWSAGASDYNVLISANNAVLGFWDNDTRNFANWKSDSSCDNASYSLTVTSGTTDAENLNLSQLFNDIANADLSIQTGNTECWALNGKAKPLSAINSDYADNSRSNDITTGVSDIGAYEFAPSSTPFPAIEVGTVANGNTTEYYVGGKQVAAIAWTGTDLPAIELYYYSGVDPVDDGNSTLTTTNYTNAYWKINETVAGDINNYTYNLTLYYTDNILQNISDEGLMNIMKNPVHYPTAADIENNWHTYAADLRDGTNNTITVNNIIGFSDFGLEEGLTPLPVTFVAVNLSYKNDRVTVDWSTASELNNDYFLVEKSANGIDFQAFEKVSGAGTSNRLNFYSAQDLNPYKGITYYRIRQVDYDGKYDFSSVKSISIPDNLNQQVLLSYLMQVQALYVENNSTAGGLARLRVYNYSGTKVKSLDFQLTSAYLIELDNLLPGFYIATLYFNQHSYVVMFKK